MRDLAKEVGCSDVGLRKTLKAAGIPFPPEGYWSKIRAGHDVARPALPKPGPGMPSGCYLQNAVPARADATGQIIDEPTPPTFDETIEDVRDRIAPTIVAQTALVGLDRPASAIQQLIDRDRRRREGAVRPGGYRTGSYEPYFESEFEQRRLILFNSIIHSLGSFVTTAYTRGSAAREIHIRIGDHYVIAMLDHPSTEFRPGQEIMPRKGKADRLRLVLGSDWRSTDYVWEDSPAGPLEKQIADIGLCIAVRGELSRRRHEHFLYERQVEKIEREKVAKDAAEREAILAREQALAAERITIEREAQEAC